MKRGEARYFLALIPKEPLATEIYRLKEELTVDYDTKAALRSPAHLTMHMMRSPAHLTMHMPFLWKERNEERLINQLAKATNFETFSIFLDGFGAFPPRTIYIKNKVSARLNAFHQYLIRHTKKDLKLLNSTHNRGFHPHITIAFRDLKEEKFEEAWKIFQNRSFEAKMEVNSFWLLKHDGKQWHAHQEFTFQKSHPE